MQERIDISIAYNFHNNTLEHNLRPKFDHTSFNTLDTTFNLEKPKGKNSNIKWLCPVFISQQLQAYNSIWLFGLFIITLQEFNMAFLPIISKEPFLTCRAKVYRRLGSIGGSRGSPCIFNSLASPKSSTSLLYFFFFMASFESVLSEPF